MQQLFTYLQSFSQYTVSGKKHPEHYWLSLEEGISNFNAFWYDYFWHSWPSDDCLIFRLTQCLLLHYLGKTEPTKYDSWNGQKYVKKHPQHYQLWLEERLTDFNNFLCKHFSQYLPSNDCYSSHLTKCLLWST